MTALEIMKVELDTASWSAIAARYVCEILGEPASYSPPEVSDNAPAMFEDIYDAKKPHKQHLEDVPGILFYSALEVGFRIAVATLTLSPEEAPGAIADLADKARVSLHNALQDNSVPPPPSLRAELASRDGRSVPV